MRGPGGAIDWQALFDERERVGEQRFEFKYWRANVSAWERYVITPAGSVKYRLAPGESGFRNLVLAGDWTKNGIDGGCVEAAVLSGIQAAQAILHPGTGFDGDTGDKWLNPDR
jgi:hypothetical protein